MYTQKQSASHLTPWLFTRGSRSPIKFIIKCSLISHHHLESSFNGAVINRIPCSYYAAIGRLSPQSGDRKSQTYALGMHFSCLIRLSGTVCWIDPLTIVYLQITPNQGIRPWHQGHVFYSQCKSLLRVWNNIYGMCFTCRWWHTASSADSEATFTHLDDSPLLNWSIHIEIHKRISL